MTRHGRRRVALAASAVVSVLGLLVLPSTVAHADALLTVTPATGLHGGDQIQVSVTGLPPSTSLAIGICQVGRPASGPGDCADTTIGASTLEVSDSGGNASAVLTVVEGPSGNASPPEFRCGPEHPCEVRASTIGVANEQVVRQVLTYATPGDENGAGDAPGAAGAADADGSAAADDDELFGGSRPGTILLIALVAVGAVLAGLFLAARSRRSAAKRGDRQ